MMCRTRIGFESTLLILFLEILLPERCGKKIN